MVKGNIVYVLVEGEDGLTVEKALVVANKNSVNMSWLEVELESTGKVISISRPRVFKTEKEAKESITH